MEQPELCTNVCKVARAEGTDVLCYPVEVSREYGNEATPFPI